MFLHYLCICVCVPSKGQSTGVEYIDIIIIVIVTAYVRILQQRKIVVDGFDAPGYNYSIKVTGFLSHFLCDFWVYVDRWSLQHAKIECS